MGRNSQRAEISTDDFTDSAERDDDVLDMMIASNEHLIRQALEEPIDEALFKSIVEYEKFMAQGVVIMINETTDKNAPPVVPCGVNGDFRWLPRGVKVRVPRKFVEVLANSQETRYKTVANRDSEADNAMKEMATTAQCYGFAVIRDPDPKGPRWLERIMKRISQRVRADEDWHQAMDNKVRREVAA